MAEFPARPRIRADCARVPRPCPYAGSCRHHLYFEAAAKGAGFDLTAATETCALDLADRGGLTLEEVGVAMRVTRERIRQIESAALKKLRAGLGGGALAEALGLEAEAPEPSRIRIIASSPASPSRAGRERPTARRRAG